MRSDASQITDRPDVSIVVATYNRSNVLRHTIESVRLQTFTSWELVVVGDCCTDDTEVVVNSFEDPRIRFHNLARRTGEQSGPNNYGATLCRADVIAYLSHDDHWLPDHLRLCWEALHTRPADVVIASAACIGARAASPLRYDALDIALLGVFPDHRYTPSSSMDVVAPASCVVMRRSVLDRLQRWRYSNEIHVEPSQDLLYRAWRLGVRMYALNEVTLVIIAAGHRPGSYLDRSADEAAWIHANLVNRQAATELAALALETNAAFAARHRPRRSAVRTAAERAIARVGVNPRRFASELKRRGRGEYLRQTLALRGVPAAARIADDPAPQLRYEMVVGACFVEPGATVRFHAGGGGARLLARGWSRPDTAGVWSDGNEAELLLDIGRVPEHTVVLHVTSRPFLGGPTGRTLRLRVKGELLGEYPLDERYPASIDVAVAASAWTTARLSLVFEIDSMSPAALGESDDGRSLGIHLETLTVSFDAHSGPGT